LRKPAADSKFSAMLDAEYILIFGSLSITVRSERIDFNKRILTSTTVFQSPSVPAEGTQNISTAERP
jgi:hypothetical protein